MLYFPVLLLCTGAVIGATVKIKINGIEKMYYDVNEAKMLFEKFIVDFGKNYVTEDEKMMRFNIFKDKLQHINELNMKHATVYGITLFTDLTAEEFSRNHRVGMMPLEGAMPCRKWERVKLASAQHRLDWRERNAVTPAKYQGHCGSCWAHSIVGCLESQYAMRFRQMLDLSEQQLVDCGPKNSCAGGGHTSNGGLYIIEQGVMSEHDYPYIDRKGSCRYNPRKVVARASKCLDFEGSSEQELMAVLATYGPISVGISGKDLHENYHGGIIQTCTFRECGHAVLLVGYNIEHPQPHWILKNSWGQTWGEKGFFRIPFGSTACMITKCGMNVLQL